MQIIDKFNLLLEWMIKLRWPILALMAIYLSSFEAEEHGATGLQILLVTEVYIYLVILFLVGISFGWLEGSNRKLKRALTILDQKHRLSSSLALESDWQNLVDRLAEVPRMVEGIEESTLLLHNQTYNRYDPVSRWDKDGTGEHHSANTEPKTICIEEIPGKFHLLKNDGGSDLKTAAVPNVYCLHIPYGREVVAMLRMRMTPGMKPAPDQVEMIDHLVNDMAAGLVTGLERKNLADLRVVEAARTERRRMSQYLHDHVSQNLGYLRLKLDQFAGHLPPPSFDDLKKDFSQMRDAANETYEIVRGSLENMQWTSDPRLLHLIQEHTEKVAQRTQLEIQVSQYGEALDLPLDVTRKIFYVIREALSNIEKHAGACKAKIELAWGHTELRVTISDNGKGFNPGEVDPSKHFGLEIMQERVAELKGLFEIRPSVDQGTVVSFRVPTNQGEIS